MRDRALRWRLFWAAATPLATIVVTLGTALPAWAAEAMTLTFVRHGESEANAAGVIDTSVPGPHLTDLGRQQAEAVADELVGNNYDGVYASSMIRTQETAQPLGHSSPPRCRGTARSPGDRRRRVRGPVGGLRPRAYRICVGTSRLDAGSTLRSRARVDRRKCLRRQGAMTPSRRSMTAAIATPWCSRTAQPSCSGR